MPTKDKGYPAASSRKRSPAVPPRLPQTDQGLPLVSDPPPSWVPDPQGFLLHTPLLT